MDVLLYDPGLAMVANSSGRDRLTDAAVARLLSVSKRTLFRWLKNGVIDPPVLVVGKRGQRRWAEHEVAQILVHMKRGDLSDSTRDIQPARRRSEDNHRRYFGKILRRQRQEGAAD
jgi:MerR HTH family regulatory protein